jgi:hypothetical protein
MKWTAGIAFNPCYQAARDTHSNVNLDAPDEMTDAIAYGILTFAMTSSAVEGTGKGQQVERLRPDVPRLARRQVSDRADPRRDQYR